MILILYIRYYKNINIILGFAIGSLIGGILYKLFGGVTTLRIFSSIAAITAFIYFILYLKYLKDMIPGNKLINL